MSLGSGGQEAGDGSQAVGQGRGELGGSPPKGSWALGTWNHGVLRKGSGGCQGLGDGGRVTVYREQSVSLARWKEFWGWIVGGSRDKVKDLHATRRYTSKCQVHFTTIKQLNGAIKRQSYSDWPERCHHLCLEGTLFTQTQIV